MMHYQPWPRLKPGNIIDIIAPCARWVNGDLSTVAAFIKDWGLIPRIPDTIYGQDLLCANSDHERLMQLTKALYAPDSAAVWCIRGGYGATRLLPELLKLTCPQHSKLFIGLSDITALHIFLQDKWHWQTLHAPSASQVAAKTIVQEDIDSLRAIIFGQKATVNIQLTPLNNIVTKIHAPITGGNLTLVQTSVGTPWQIDTEHKIVFLEEVNERAFRVDRALVHLSQAGVFTKAKAIIFGDFIGGLEPNGDTLIKEVLSRFANNQTIPIYQCSGIGHGKQNAPLPFGTLAELSDKLLNIQLI